MQVARSLLLATWFNCCCVVILVTQVLGAPLYLINKGYYYTYMAYTKQSFGLVITALTQWGCPTFVRVSGDKSIRGQVQLTSDGRLKTQFPERLVLIANHQVYTDWIYLWWVAYTNIMHGRIFIILKESLKYIPIVGQGMMFYGFIFMARKWLSDKPRLQHRLAKLKTRHSGSRSESSQYDPMWLLIFPEGTNLSTNTKQRSDEYGEKQGFPPLKHEVLPRSTGLFFCLQQLKGTVDWVYDCTVAYEGPPKGSYPDKYFTLRSTYLQGRPPTSVNMYWRRFAVSEIPLDDQKEFDTWLRGQWTEKDRLLDEYFETGRFPSDLSGSIDNANVSEEQQAAAAAAGYVESFVKLGHWSEIGRIFMVLIGAAFIARPKIDNILAICGGAHQPHHGLRPPTLSSTSASTRTRAGGRVTLTISLHINLLANLRFSDIPSAIDIPASTLDSEVEVSLEGLPDDPTELCTLLENEKAAKNFWVIIALAYAKQKQIDHAIDILNKGLASVAHGATKEKLGLLGWVCWLLMLKSRQAPRVAPEGELYAEAKTKDHYLQLATSTLNEASRLNPAFPPLFLARGVLSLLRSSLYPPRPVRPGTVDTSERVESLRQALKCFDESSKAFGGRNVMATLGRARTQYMLGRYAEALEDYQKVLMKMPGLTDPDPRIGIGCCLWHLGFKDQAKAAWERALVLNPDSKVANILLAVYYLYDSSRHATTDPAFGSLYKVAMTHYTQKAFKLDKEYPMTCALFGGYFLLRKSYSTVETLARKAIEHTDVMQIASDGWYLLGRKAHYENDLPRAAEFYNRSDQARGGGDKGYLPARFGTVQMQVSNKDYDGAKFRLEKIIQQTKNPECMILLGALYAEEVFVSESSSTREDKSAEAKKAINLLESVRALWKDEGKKIAPDESVLVYLARLYEHMAPEKSMQCLAQLEELQLAAIAEDEHPGGVEDEEQVKAALRVNLPPQLLNNMGCFLYQTEKVDQARTMFETALNACVRSQEKESEHDTDALVTTISYNLGRTYEASDMPEEAKKVYEGLLERHGNYTEANARLTYIALRQSPTDEGPKRMAKLYEADSTNLEVRALFGWYLSKSKKRVANLAEDQEQRHYKHTLQYFDKHDRYSLTGMGNVHIMTARDMRRDTDQEKEKRRRMYERAVEFFDKALQLDPRNAYAAQGIAIALVDAKKDYSTAVHIFSKIRDTLRDSSVYLNLGHVYAELRQHTRSIEHYEAALSKDRARDAQILACLGRVWLLKGKQEMSLSAMKTALDYARRAHAAAPSQIHLEFNVAFVQNQIASLAYSLPETQKTVQDVQDASDGLREAVESFGRISLAKNPPYPAGALEQRANMGKTIIKQLERALQSQKEYEKKNAAKLQQAREAREAEIRRREEDVRKAQEAERERKQRVAEERQRMVEEAQRLAEQRAEEERARDEAELTTESETGAKVKRKKKSSSSKRKKKRVEDDFISDGESPTRARSSELESDGETAPKKRRRLERRTGGKAQSKYKSSEMVVDSDEEDIGGAATTPAVESDHNQEMPDTGADEDEEEVVQRRRAKVNRRIADDDEEEEHQPGAKVGLENADDLFNDPAGDDDAAMEEE
ncbi:putative RNA polymerase II transcription elongation factor (Ctr9) [Aspergillus alliaceus]|uniref:putative RNA polymerase II transcription elongation factor (Ctr9) n=1 Tax=Petromyces alliaceus TaxID=209559 RepID=UPI0012A5EF13|nr:HCP-like protein [Aspergillus alliaceus]KAB8232149.1 HCP-like protein [Aspergillus alliaceus]